MQTPWKNVRETVTAFIRGLNATISLLVIQRKPNDLQEDVQTAGLAQMSLTALLSFGKDNASNDMRETLKLQQETIAQLKQSVAEMKTATRVNVTTGRKFDTKCQLRSKIGHEAKLCRKFVVREKRNSQSYEISTGRKLHVGVAIRTDIISRVIAWQTNIVCQKGHFVGRNFI